MLNTEDLPSDTKTPNFAQPELEPSPRVAVLLPVYNGERFLAQALESIVAQTYADFELLILDDGSTDSSSDIAKEFASRYANVRYERLPHAGLVETLNSGLHLTSAEYVARMDADDISLPARLEIQVDFLDRHPGIGALGTNAYVIDTNGRRLGKSRTGPTTRDQFLRSCQREELITLCHPTVMFRRRIVADLGGYRPECFPAEDLDLWNRMAESTEIRCLPDFLLDYRLHQGAVTAINSQLSMSTARRIKHNLWLRRGGLKELNAEDFAKFERSQPAYRRFKISIHEKSNAYYSSGAWLLASGHLSGIGKLAAAFILNPGLIGRLASRLTK